MNIEELLIREAIRYTISRYTSAADRGAYHEMVDVFTPDGVMAFGGAEPLKGRDVIIASMTAGSERRGSKSPQNFQRHFLGQSFINVLSDTTARSVHYIVTITEKGLDHSGVYIDDFVKSGERWLIAHRAANLEWVSPDSRYAAPGNPPATPTAKSELDLQFILGAGSASQ